MKCILSPVELVSFCSTMRRKPADAFPAADPKQWREIAEASLRGRSVDSLRRRTDSGLELEPVYFAPAHERPSESPGTGSFRRGALVVPPIEGWDLRARIARGGPAAINRQALTELEGGANSLELVGESLRIGSAEQLNEALEGIYLDLAPVALDAGVDFEQWVEWLCEVWSRREHDPALVEGAWNIDPVRLAVAGRLPEEAADVFGPRFENAVNRAVALAATAAGEWRKVTTFRVGTEPFHLGGCNDAQELAVALATGLHYLRAMESADIELDRAFEQIVVGLQVDADLFAGITKLRAARALWTRMAQACGVELRRGLRIEATTAMRMLSAREPMTNALRATTGAAAAVLGGADVITVRPYDAATGARSKRAMRLARNTQVILRSESNLHHVIDSAGGSWYLESRTDALIHKAWTEFQAIEAAGGIVADLRAGRLQRVIGEAAMQRGAQIRKRKRPLVGVSDFARLQEDSPDADVAAPGSTVENTETEETEGTTESLFPMQRLDWEFEQFRLASDVVHHRTGSRPQVWLANLGSLAQHNPRSTFMRNLLAAGGIEAIDGPSVGTPEGLSAAASDANLTAQTIAVLCSSDALYEAAAVPALKALRAAGVVAVYYAGHPGERREALTEAGFDGFVHIGVDVIAVFEELYRRLEIDLDKNPSEGPAA